MSIVFWVFSIIGFVLQAALIHVLVARGLWRRYFPLLAYCVVLLLSGLVDKGLRFDVGSWNQYRIVVYWTDDSLRWLFLLIVTFWLLFQALKARQGKTSYFLTILLGAVLAVALSAALQPTNVPSISHWFTPVLRNVGVIAMILNLILWMLLIGNRNLPRDLLLLSGGMGIQMAGEAAGHSVRLFTLYMGDSQLIRYTANVIMILAHFLCLAIWLSAARSCVPVAASPKVPRQPVPSPENDSDAEQHAAPSIRK